VRQKAPPLAAFIFPTLISDFIFWAFLCRVAWPIVIESFYDPDT
jgi:hypothetical protein